MASPLVEGLERDIFLFPELLQNITGDVVSGVETMPGVNQKGLVGTFIKDIRHELDSNRMKYNPGGEYFQVMKTLQGDSFTSLPFKARFLAVAETDALTDEQKHKLVTDQLTNLYTTYHETEPTNWDGSQIAWQSFVEALKLFNAYVFNNKRKNAVEFNGGYFPIWWVNDKIYLCLPALAFYDYARKPSLDTNAALTNTELQMKIAREVEILTPEESWSDLINRSNIKLVHGYYEVKPDDDGLIIGKRNIDYSLGGRASCYSNVPTKYPQTIATIYFDTHYDLSGLYNQRLEDLITQGIVSPKVILEVPTQIVLAIDKLK